MSAEDIRQLKQMAQGDGELRVGKGLLRSLIAHAETAGTADRADAPSRRNVGHEQ